MLVSQTTADDPSYGVHCNKDDSQQLDVIKIRLSNLIAASGHYGTAFVKVLVFTEDEMPVDKVPNEIILLKQQGLAADAGVNPHSVTEGIVLCVRKGVNIETDDELVAEPFIDQLRSMLGLTDPCNVPAYARVLLTCDGGVPQMKAMQSADSLKRRQSEMNVRSR